MPENAPPATVKARVNIKKAGLYVVLALLVIGALGFLVLPPVVNSLLTEQLSRVLHRPVEVGSVSINPYTLSAQVGGLRVGEKGGGSAVVSFETLFVDVDWGSLLRGGPVVSEVRLAAPMLRLVRLPDGRLNFSDLIDEFMARPATDDPLPLFSINNIKVSDGKIEFDDQVLAESHLISDINIGLPFISTLPDSTEIFVEPVFSASIDGAPLAVQGRSKPFADSQESEIGFALHAVQVGKYIGYSPIRLPVKVLSGVLDGDLKIVFKRNREEGPSLSLAGTAMLADLVVQDTGGAPLLALKRLEVAASSLDPLRRRFAIDRVAAESPEIHARVGRQGEVNWIEYFKQETAARQTSSAAAASAAATAPVEWSLAGAKISGGALRWLDESHGTPFKASIEGIEVNLGKVDSRGGAPTEFDAAWRVDFAQWLKTDAVAVRGGRLDLVKRQITIDEVSSRTARVLLRRTADGRIEFVPPPQLRAVAAARKDPEGPWKIVVSKYRGEDLAVRFEDAAVSPATTHTLDGMSLLLENVSSDLAQRLRLSTRFRLNRKGEIELAGDIRPAPLDTDLKLLLRTVELLPLQPYFTERLNIDLTRGQVTLAGNVQLRQTSGGSFEAGKLSGGFSGQVTVGDLQAVDKLNSADFVKWKSLYFGHVDAKINPNSLSIGQVALADFFARVIVSRQGDLNLLQIVRQPEPHSAAAAVAADKTAPSAAGGKATAAVAISERALPAISIGKITLQGGDIRFTDNFVKPNYSANLRQVGGTISGLSSAPNTVASLDLRGTYDNIAPLMIAGQLNPLARKPSLDLQAEVKGIEMTSLSPYSGKYAGYAIEKGKLSVYVKYKIDDRQLSAENRIFLDQLTFGSPVDSPDATKLPVTLAVALLKNRNGEIDINLPISGSLDDPEFSVGGLIVKVVVNLLGKALTSPFALLGAVFGGGEELSSLDFDSGRAGIAGEAVQRLDKLGKALLDRPALKLEIQGTADPETDSEGLKRDRLERKVKALQREELTRKAVQTGSADEITVSAKEYPVLLERVYRNEKFPKPRNLVGLVKGLPSDEMEKLILANSAIDEDDLRDLADRRGKAARDWLLAHDIPGERVFLLPGKVGSTDGKNGSAAPAKGGRAVFSLR